MLNGSDHMGDAKVIVVYDTCQVVQTGPIGPLNHMVLLVSPLNGTIAPNQIMEFALPTPRHLQSHHRRSPIGLVAPLLLGRIGHEPPIVDKRFPVLFSLSFQLRQFLGLGVVLVSMPAGKKLLDSLLVLF